MPYYLAPYEKVPVRDAVQFRPAGCEDLVRGPIDLRPDGGATLEGGGLNACLLWLPSRSADWRLTLLAEAPEERIGEATQRVLRSLLWLPDVPRVPFGDLVLRLMLEPPRDGWRPLQPTRSDVYEVWLGGRRIAALRSIRGGTTITESFNKADNGLGPNLTWTIISGSTLGVHDNQAFGGNTPSEARADSDLATDDHYAQAEAGASYPGGGGVNYIGVLCRKDATATLTHYRWANFGADGGWELAKFVGGSETVLDSAYTTDPAATESFKIDANGSTIRGFHTAATQRASVTDTAITGNLRTGIMLRNSYLDTFEAGDLAVAGSSIAVKAEFYRRMRMR